MSRKAHQERTKKAAWGVAGYTSDHSRAVALWQIAHSLAVIADALEDTEPTVVAADESQQWVGGSAVGGNE